MSTSITGAAEPARPFPQHTHYAAGAILPRVPRPRLDAAVAAAYDAWKARYLHPGCEPGQAYIAYNLEGRAERKDAISCSEGHGYGMLLTAFMAGHDPQARQSFDALHAFYRAHPSGLTPGLMAWQQVKGCRDVKGENDSASDGDLDIAYALLLADRQWGSEGPVNYREEALRTIAAIRQGDMNHAAATVKLGDWETAGPGLGDIRLSDIMPDHFRAFSRATGDPLWERTLNRGYECLGFLQGQNDTGLIPDFARQAAEGKPIPAPPKFLESKHDGQYFYNACRVPWRLGVDALIHGDPRARTFLTRLNGFITRATQERPAQIRAGYRLHDGKPIDAEDTSRAFTAPFAVAAAIDPQWQTWLDGITTQLIAPAGPDDDYYGATVSLLSLIAISGNWWSP